MPNHCVTECRYGSPSVAAVKIELHWPLMAAGLPLLGGFQHSTWLGGCWNHVRGCVDRETGEGMHEAALCVVKWMAQTGKTSAEPEYYLGLIFFRFVLLFFIKRRYSLAFDSCALFVYCCKVWRMAEAELCQEQAPMWRKDYFVFTRCFLHWQSLSRDYQYQSSRSKNSCIAWMYCVLWQLQKGSWVRPSEMLALEIRNYLPDVSHGG